MLFTRRIHDYFAPMPVTRRPSLVGYFPNARYISLAINWR